MTVAEVDEPLVADVEALKSTSRTLRFSIFTAARTS